MTAFVWAMVWQTALVALAAAATAAPAPQVAAPPPAPVPNPAPAPQQAARPVPVSTNVMEASCISCKAPTYPPEAKAAGLQGTVEMHIQIGTDGAVAAVNCAVGDPTLFAAAQKAVSHWLYRPLKLNGRPIPISNTVTSSTSTMRRSPSPFRGSAAWFAMSRAGAFPAP